MADKKVKPLETEEQVEIKETPEARATEYFEIKETLKTLKEDLKDLKEQHLDHDELKEVTQKAKELRDNIKNDENIRIIQEKIETLKERTEMIKEIIKVELLENNQVEVKADGKKLKIVTVLKETKDDGA